MKFESKHEAKEYAKKLNMTPAPFVIYNPWHKYFILGLHEKECECNECPILQDDGSFN
jgi:hypothetical protein